MTARIAEQNLAEDAANAGPAPDHARTPVEPGVVHGLSKAAVSTIPPPKLLLVQPSIALDQVDTSNMTSSQLRAHKYVRMSLQRRQWPLTCVGQVRSVATKDRSRQGRRLSQGDL